MRVPVIPLAALAFGGLLYLVIPFRGPRSNGTSPEVTPAMTNYAAHQWPGTTAAQLQEGRGLLRERCIKCHHRPGPEMSQAAQWSDVLKLMAKRAELSDSERETVLHYLLAAKAMAQ